MDASPRKATLHDVVKRAHDVRGIGGVNYLNDYPYEAGTRTYPAGH